MPYKEIGPNRMRAGIGYDVHMFQKNRKLILGGVEIKHPAGLAGHSDADVLVHAIMDSLLGAAGLDDIGVYFPDTDDAFKNISSLNLLSKVGTIIKEAGYTVINIDSIIIMEKPKVAPYTAQMKKNIARALEADEERIGIKATTTESLGFCGRGEGAAAQAVALLEKNAQ